MTRSFGLMEYTAAEFEMIKKTQWMKRSGRWKHLDDSSFASLLIRSSARRREGRRGRAQAQPPAGTGLLWKGGWARVH